MHIDVAVGVNVSMNINTNAMLRLLFILPSLSICIFRGLYSGSGTVLMNHFLNNLIGGNDQDCPVLCCLLWLLLGALGVTFWVLSSRLLPFSSGFGALEGLKSHRP